MKLLIISHTEHYIKNQEIVGWNPTIREINQLANLFETVTHLAPLHLRTAPEGSIGYSNPNILFSALKPSGGNGIYEKLKVLWYAIPNLIEINKACKKADIIHFRAPTNLGVYTLPFLWFYRKKKQWIKYAGNWMQEGKPLSYRFQKWWIQKNFNKGVATINGHWPNQAKHIYTFENPCLTLEENRAAQLTNRDWIGKFTICFAGALNPEKGAFKIVQALNNLNESEVYIEKFIIAGDGVERNKILEYDSKIKIELRGFLKKDDLFKVYSESHLIILPSSNEGFPKTITEAMAFGCIPIVTDVSCISQYVIDNVNGFLLKTAEAKEITKVINKLIDTDISNLELISNKAKETSLAFTYENYLEKVKNLILK